MATNQSTPALDWANSMLERGVWTDVSEVSPGGFVPEYQSLNNVLYGGLGSPNTELDFAGNMDSLLSQISAAAGIPDYDWMPAKAAAAKQHFDQFGTVYTNASPWENIFQSIIGNSSDPRIAQVWERVAPEVIPQLADSYRQYKQSDDERSDKRYKQSIAGLLTVASAGLGSALAGGSAASGGSATAGFGEAAYAGGGALAEGGGGAAAIGAGYQPPNYPTGAEGEFGIGNYDPNVLALEAGDYGGLGGAASAPAASGGVGTTAGTAASGTALSRILDGSATQADYLSIIGQAGPGLLQMYGANQQQNQLANVASQYQAMGAPYRSELASISADPNKFYQGPAAQQGLEAVLRKLSISGNPAGSPYSQSLALGSLYDRYGQERDRLAGFGGLTAYNQAAPQAAQNAIGASGGIYSGLGSAMGNVLNPQRSLADIFRGVTY